MRDNTVNSEMDSLLFRGQYLADDELELLKHLLGSMKVDHLKKTVEAFGSTANWGGVEERYNWKAIWDGPNWSNTT